MKTLILLSHLFSIPAVAETLTTLTTKSVGGTTTVQYKESAEIRDCQVQNGPGVIMYGLCYKEGNTVIFKSCVDFTCQLDKDVVAGPLDPGRESCFTDKDPVKFKSAALAEHKVAKLSKINNCGYSDKKGAK